MHLIEQIISTIAPHHCIECGAEGKPLCESCSPDIFGELPQVCAFCDALTMDGRVCGACQPSMALQRVWWLAEYETTVEKLIHNLKFARQRAVAEILAAQLDAALPQFDPSIIVSWLPTSPSRVRQRGYDQAALVAKYFAKRRQLRCVRLLHRKHNQRQVGADKRTRFIQAQAAYWRAKSSFPPQTPILLIDDVLTTGASLQAAAALLAEAGYLSLNAAVIAKRPFKK